MWNRGGAKAFDAEGLVRSSAGEERMSEAVFRIAPQGDEWRLEYEAESQAQHVACMTKEAAFEAAVMAAQRAMREAHAVHITVDPAPNVLVGHGQN
jgi:hypothetical protein